MQMCKISQTLAFMIEKWKCRLIKKNYMMAEYLLGLEIKWSLKSKVGKAFGNLSATSGKVHVSEVEKSTNIVANP